MSSAERRIREKEEVESREPLENRPENLGDGVLLANKLIELCEDQEPKHRMIAPFDRSQLHPAGYKLRVGDQFAIGGEIFTISEFGEYGTRKNIVIEPFQVAIIRTQEVLCIPRFLIARWNIMVKSAYKGLLWVGAAQVDPGWIGRLACPIYNLSNEAVTLKYGDDLALMDFVTTTEVRQDWMEKCNPKTWEKYKKTDKILLEDYPVELQSALFTQAAQKIKEVEGSQRGLERRMTTFTTIVISALAVVPAFLASVGFNQSGLIVSIWAPVAIGASAFALLWSLSQPVARIGENAQKVIKNNSWRIWSRVGSVLFVLVVGSLLTVWSAKYTRDAQNSLITAIQAAGVERVAEILTEIRNGQAVYSESDIVRELSYEREIEARLAELERYVVELRQMISERPRSDEQSGDDGSN